MYKKMMMFSLVCTSVFASNPIESERNFSSFVNKVVIDIDEGNLTFKGGLRKDGIKVLAHPRGNSCYDNLKIQEQELNLINKKNQGGCPCDYTIYVPQEALIDIKSGASHIDLDNMTGSLKVKNGVGNIKGNSSLAQADVQLGTGNVTLNVNRASSSINIGTGNGSLYFSEIPQNKVNLNITTGIGNTDLILPADSKVHYNGQVDNSHDYNFKVNLSSGMGSANISKI